MSVNAILTGQTKEPNIDLTKANVTGILPVTKGGTGNATGAIDLTKGTGILPIASGGTGASSASTALSNLGGITQATADGRYLGKTAQAADSAKLGGMTTGGKTWPFIASVAEDGVMEIGQYIDFHTKSGLTTDYDGRISLTGNAFDMGGKKLSGVGTPTAASDAATKQYVDDRTIKFDAGGLLRPGEKIKLGISGMDTTITLVSTNKNSYVNTYGVYYLDGNGIKVFRGMCYIGLDINVSAVFNGYSDVSIITNNSIQTFSNNSLTIKAPSNGGLFIIN